jgi:predicted transcriptional regulator
MKYTTHEVAKILKVSDRTVRRYINAHISIDNKGFEISDKILEVLKKEYSGQVSDNTGQQEYENLEGFTKEEYQ